MVQIFAISHIKDRLWALGSDAILLSSTISRLSPTPTDITWTPAEWREAAWDSVFALLLDFPSMEDDYNGLL